MLKLLANKGISIPEIIEKPIKKLLSDGRWYKFLRRIDALLINVIRQLSAKYIVIINLILHPMKQSTYAFVGIMLFYTLDIKHLKLIHGLPILLIPLMHSSFIFHQLVYSLRTFDKNF